MQALLGSGVFALFLMAQILAVMALRGQDAPGPPDRRREAAAARSPARQPSPCAAVALSASGP